ncbi:hypothetical protein ABIE63_003052 [Limibacillus sp. MBR-115]|jgi:hypothetical protein
MVCDMPRLMFQALFGVVGECGQTGEIDVDLRLAYLPRAKGKGLGRKKAGPVTEPGR